jgi:hypothetical protein
MSRPTTPTAEPWRLTPTRWRVLEVMHALHAESLHTGKRGYGVTYDDVAHWCGVSSEAVRSAAKFLIRQGLVCNRPSGGQYAVEGEQGAVGGG